jgi:hypothetical protein
MNEVQPPPTSEILGRVKVVLEEIFSEIEKVIKGDKKINSLKDLADFIDLLVDLLRAIINAFIQGLPLAIKFWQYVVDVITNILDIILNNKNIIEIVVLVVPALPLLYLLYQTISKI